MLDLGVWSTTKQTSQPDYVKVGRKQILVAVSTKSGSDDKNTT